MFGTGLLSIFSNGPAPTQRATPDDRRALSPSDINELLAIRRHPPDPKKFTYDPSFWDEWDGLLKQLGQKSRCRLTAWRARRDYRWLEQQGFRPTGEGPLWVQVEEALKDRSLRAPHDMRVRLRQTARWLSRWAPYYPQIARYQL